MATLLDWFDSFRAAFDSTCPIRVRVRVRARDRTRVRVRLDLPEMKRHLVLQKQHPWRRPQVVHEPD